MKCVIDTHIALWDVFQPEKLTHQAQQWLEESQIIMADISLWEIAMLAEKKRIILPVDTETFLQRYCEARAVDIKPITSKIAAMSVEFGMQINMDPADRLIVATAITEHCPLMTADRNLQQSDLVEVIW